jgi:hypothetical protein
MPGNTTDQITRVITDLHPTTTLPHGQTAACSLSDRMAHFAKLDSNSAAALAGLMRRVVAQVAEADLSKSRRVIFIFLSPERVRFAPGGSFRRTAAIRKVSG